MCRCTEKRWGRNGQDWCAHRYKKVVCVHLGGRARCGCTPAPPRKLDRRTAQRLAALDRAFNQHIAEEEDV